MKKKDELAPGTQGCLGKAKDDEMLFILRAQDVTAPATVLEWMKSNILTCPAKKLREALECAIVMRDSQTRKIAD